jgi:hypothetical protein
LIDNASHETLKTHRYAQEMQTQVVLPSVSKLVFS